MTHSEQPRAYSYIRFSTPEQIKGDSLRRQIEKSNEYIEKNNLVLDTSLNLRDLGQSAFHGSHKTDGNLGKFLHLVEQGMIPEGSFLIVENLDRLSREEISTALKQFLGIIDAGIKLVTLHDKMEYDKKSVSDNWTQLIISISYMARAHEESKVKSERLQESWINRRQLATNGKRKLTGVCPAWLQISEDKESFIG
jgi:DNA invertase Pin-like site-specific DNA recombinase